MPALVDFVTVMPLLQRADRLLEEEKGTADEALRHQKVPRPNHAAL